MKCTEEEMRKELDHIRNEWFAEWNRTNVKPTWNYEEKQEQIMVEWLQSFEVGDRAHICHYSDKSPCTVIKRTATTITVRNDTAHKSDKWNPQWIAGGFAGHCTNNDDQSDWWVCEEDPNGTVEVFRWRKSRKRWMNTADEKLLPEWRNFYDYNF